MRYHPLYEGFWDEVKLEGCPPEERLLAVYLFSNPKIRPSGIYRITDQEAALGAKIPLARAPRYMADLHARGFIVRDGHWILVVGYFRLQPKQPFLLKGARVDVHECCSVPILETLIKRYPLLNQWSADRLATIAQPSANGTTRAYADADADADAEVGFVSRGPCFSARSFADLRPPSTPVSTASRCRSRATLRSANIRP